MTFTQKLEKAIKRNNSLLCVGLDPDPQKLTKNQSQINFNKQVIDQTADLVCAYKPNIAFYEAVGLEGLQALKETIFYLKKEFPHIPIVLDAKRADIGSTSEMYAKAAFDFLDVDAATVNPYLGKDALEPFFKRKGRGVFVICRTSNPSATNFQDLKIGRDPLYVKVAKEIIAWNKKYPNVYLEIGATWPGEIGVLRKLTPNMIFLVAGIGAQGGDLKGTLKNGLTKNGDGLIINSSRGIIYAQNPRAAAQKLRDEINKYR